MWNVEHDGAWSIGVNMVKIYIYRSDVCTCERVRILIKYIYISNFKKILINPTTTYTGYTHIYVISGIITELVKRKTTRLLPRKIW